MCLKDLRKRVAYLQGLMEGMELGDTKEGRVLTEVVGVLNDVADTLVELGDNQADLESYVESIDEDLNDLEDEILEGTDETEEYLEVECPECHDTVCFDADILEDDDVIEVTCPNCDTVVFVNDQDFELVEEPDTLVAAPDDDL